MYGVWVRTIECDTDPTTAPKGKKMPLVFLLNDVLQNAAMKHRTQVSPTAMSRWSNIRCSLGLVVLALINQRGSTGSARVRTHGTGACATRRVRR